MDNKYYYLDGYGNVQGPFWLSVMRNLWNSGRFTMSTEVSLNGTEHWQRIEFHPEIFENFVKMPTLNRITRAKSDPTRLIVWTAVLFLAYAAYLLVNMARDMEKKQAPALQK